MVTVRMEVTVPELGTMRVAELSEIGGAPLEGDDTADRETVPENPLTPDKVTVRVALDPSFTLRLVGLTVTVKSGPLTSTLIE